MQRRSKLVAVLDQIFLETKLLPKKKNRFFIVVN